MMHTLTPQRTGITLALLLFVATGCSQLNTETTAVQSPSANIAGSSTKVAKIKVVTTFLPMYMFTKAVTGDVAQVDILVPPGTDVHDYQAKPENVKALAQANVLVKNGLGLEEFLAGTVKNAQNRKLTEIDASSGIKALESISPVVQTQPTGKKDEHETGNPHVWLDPVLVKQQVTNIRNGLITVDPANKATYETNAAAYIRQLDDLNNEFQAKLRKYPNCTFITFHDAFPYLAKRYNLKQVAVVKIPEDQLSPTDVQNAVNAVKQYKVKALFSEPGVDNKLLTSLSQDLHLTLHPLDSMETGQTEPQHYFEAMRANLQTLETSCK
ncbi:MAG: zinc ABC transporter substrate-binding protein [Nostocaceae cyanobacterium]|nr:zinc ABC transporter substrate-binding protein [Nostocaceae cyanobacterium]